MVFAEKHPEAVQGILALAPYLGGDALLEEIRGEGGLSRWTARPSDDFGRLWSWLKGYASAPGSRPPLYLGYGRDDRYALGHGLLAAALPPDHVLVTGGAHRWDTWRTLWRTFLARGGFGQASGGGPRVDHQPLPRDGRGLVREQERDRGGDVRGLRPARQALHRAQEPHHLGGQ